MAASRHPPGIPLIKRHSREATIIAALQADKRAEAGDMEGQVV